jgi:competence protein ComEA
MATPGSASQFSATTTQPTSRGTSERINLNKADAAALESLPGIGDVLATRIVADREKNGPFKSIDDLKRVPGIKDAVVSKLREMVYVEP